MLVALFEQQLRAGRRARAAGVAAAQPVASRRRSRPACAGGGALSDQQAVLGAAAASQCGGAPRQTQEASRRLQANAAASDAAARHGNAAPRWGGADGAAQRARTPAPKQQLLAHPRITRRVSTIFFLFSLYTKFIYIISKYILMEFRYVPGQANAVNWGISSNFPAKLRIFLNSIN